MTDEIRANIEQLKKMKDEDIDLTEMPEADAEFWKNSVSRDEFFRARKQSTTVRIDADVLHWLKKDGKGYQSRLNAILRKEMMESVSAVKAATPKRQAKRTVPARTAAAPARRQKLSA